MDFQDALDILHHGVAFSGSDYQPERDKERLTQDYKKIKDLMSDGEWRTIRQVADATGSPDGSASAHMRAMRKKENGGHAVIKKYEGNGKYLYRLVINQNTQTSPV